MKKLFSIFSALSLAVLLSIPVANASSFEPGKVLYHQVEIKDLNQLFKNAKEGKQDVSLAGLNLPNYKLINNKTKKEEKINQYYTTQLLEVKQQGNGIVETIALTSLAQIPHNSVSNNVMTASTVSPMTDSGGSNYQYTWDGSYSVEAYSTMYYEKYVGSDGITYARCTEATGGWYIDDPTVWINGRVVNMGTSGWPYGTQATSHYPSGDSFDYYAPSWGYVSLNANHSVGVTTIVTLNRGTSSWNLKLNNNI